MPAPGSLAVAAAHPSTTWRQCGAPSTPMCPARGRTSQRSSARSVRWCRRHGPKAGSATVALAAGGEDPERRAARAVLNLIEIPIPVDESLDPVPHGGLRPEAGDLDEILHVGPGLQYIARLQRQIAPFSRPSDRCLNRLNIVKQLDSAGVADLIESAGTGRARCRIGMLWVPLGIRRRRLVGD